jgi:hypothetical protein
MEVEGAWWYGAVICATAERGGGALGCGGLEE